ncbi:Hypothetical predicted protein [Pelobates cultripes]|uniref:Uncharacterized protein n=1 Tax=Pelobates cultripes TaxID=61616 RepID=A0AAD1WMU8_PELCU|nr:Hypothetical predicted protein [Pelobates cultripes]
MSQINSGNYQCMASNYLGGSLSPSVSLICVGCSFPNATFFIILGAAGGSIVFILTFILVMLRKRKKLNNQIIPNEVVESSNNVYTNVLFSDNTVSLEDPYTSLQKQNRCPDYDEIKKFGPPERPCSQTYPEYEEVFPCKALDHSYDGHKERR